MVTTIRAFGGTLAEAEGILAVERATFNESPYQAAEIQAMLSGGPQHAWLAVQAGARNPGAPPSEGPVVGFVIAFVTSGWERRWWEIDLLAVHPRWTGQGLASRLIEAAAAHGASHARQARAVVGTDNAGSTRAFSRAGFQPAAEAHRLLIYRPQGLAPRPVGASRITIRALADGDSQVAVEGNGQRAPQPVDGRERWSAQVLCPRQSFDPATLLLAEDGSRRLGHAELIAVQTLLYRGVWIESLAGHSRAARTALVRESVERAKRQGLDEIGAMVPERDWLLREALVAAGFRSLGEFRWFTAGLPL